VLPPGVLYAITLTWARKCYTEREGYISLWFDEQDYSLDGNMTLFLYNCHNQAKFYGIEELFG
jgi:hypothetical protein